MDGKKISFSFLKTKKAERPVVEEKKDFIECVEEKSIKVVGGEEAEEKTPLVIPMKPNTLITTERLKEIAEKVEKGLEEPEPDEKPVTVKEEPPENETIEQMAIRELMQEAKKEVKVETDMLTVPVPAKTVMDGQKESTLEDYEAVPVQDFGMAMLRGMGWTQSKDQAKYKQPQLRPKGLGLGADKVIKENQKKKTTKDKEEELSIVKNSFVKITTGKYNGCYGKVVSLDEENGRVMVDISIKKETVSLSEFMMQPVTKSEFDKESKVINADTYQEYKKKEKGQKSSRNESPKVTEKEPTSSQKSSDLSTDYRGEKKKDDGSRKESEKSSNGRSKDRSHRDRRDSSSEERSRRKLKKKYSSNDSLSSLSETEKRRKHKSSRKRHSSSESGGKRDSHKKDRRSRNATPEGKRDIDKKRKGKKKKRDRDRSPNYRKHRK